MTYGEAVKIALLKADSEIGDFDNTDIFAAAADEAQKKIAFFGRHIKKIKSFSVENAPETVELPEDLYEICGVKKVKVTVKDDESEVRVPLKDMTYTHYFDDTKIIIEKNGDYDLYYYAKPKNITEDFATEEEREDYEFEVPNDTHVAIPFYIAYELVKIDDTQLAQILLNEWNRYMSLFDDRPFAVQKRIDNLYI